MCDGDSNGVLHYLGTQRTAQQHAAEAAAGAGMAPHAAAASSSAGPPNLAPSVAGGSAGPTCTSTAPIASSALLVPPSPLAIPSHGLGPSSPPLCVCVWVNPALSKMVDVRASSPAAPRTTDPKAISGRQFTRTNFAGPRCAAFEAAAVALREGQYRAVHCREPRGVMQGPHRRMLGPRMPA